jgi:hypothetical protein
MFGKVQGVGITRQVGALQFTLNLRTSLVQVLDERHDRSYPVQGDGCQ